MRRLLIPLLCLFHFISLQAQTLPTEQVQVRLGRLLPTDSVRIYLEYPELEPLSRSEVKAYQVLGFRPLHDVQLQETRGLSRGETLADVSFVPIVVRDGKWYRVKSYEVKKQFLGPKLSPACRVAVQAAQRVAAAGRYTPHSVLAEGSWVKICVKEEGIYQITDAELRNMGFSDPTKVKLYGYGGRLLPDNFTFTGSESLIDDLCEVPLYRRSGSVLFFAEGLLRYTSSTRFQRNTFSNYSYYFLTEATESSGEPAAWSVLSAPAFQGKEVNQVDAYALIDNDAFVWYGGGRDFYDDSDLLSGVRYKLSLPGHVGGECTVCFDVSAQNSTNLTTVTIDQELTGTQVAKAGINIYGEGESAKGYRGSFTATLGEEERFMVKSTSTARLNYLYTVYPQHLRTDCTTHAFTAGTSGAVTLQVAAADANTRVWQLGNAQSAVAELPGTLQNNVYTAQAVDGKSRFVLVDVSKTYPSPQVVGPVANQDLHADTAIDYVIIVPSSGKLTAQAERLAEAHRAKQGMSVKVVTAGQLYNEFSSGTPDVAAYRRYLKMLYDRAGDDVTAPRYLLLFGDCTFDNRMVTSDWRNISPDDYLLAMELNDQESYQNTNYSIGTMHSYVTDDYFGFLDDGEGTPYNQQKLDLGIGRFLCHKEADAQWLTDRAIEYLNNESVGSWKNQMWAVADVGDDNLHMNDAQKVANQVSQSAGSHFLLRRIYPDAYVMTQAAQGGTYPEATQKLKSAMQRGALIFNYNGHGSPDRLSHKFLLNKEEMSANQSEARPLWIFASCEITPYDQVCADLGRNALFCQDGPAVGVICAARSVYANYNRSLNMGFVHFAFSQDADGKSYTLGDALRLTKCQLIKNTEVSIGTDQTINKLKYVLLGDPALTLAYPRHGLVIDSINGSPVQTGVVQPLPIGSKATFSGHVALAGQSDVPDNGFTGELTATVFAPLQSITCKGQGNSKASPLVYTDYTKTVFEGKVRVNEGRFSLSFMVPRGITFSTAPGLLSLYAIDSTHVSEYNGSFAGFCFNGTAADAPVDTIGPDIYLYLDRPDFISGATVGTDATFYAHVSDSSAISIISGNLGHDMELWLDGQPSGAVVLNDNFSFDYGSYQTGLATYPLTGLTEGLHTLSFRAWDVFDNSTTSTLTFRVSAQGAPDFDVQAVPAQASASTRFVTAFPASEGSDGAQVLTEVFNISGMRVWHSTASIPANVGYASVQWNLTDYAGSRLPRGVYLYRSKVGGKETSTHKMVIL